MKKSVIIILLIVTHMHSFGQKLISFSEDIGEFKSELDRYLNETQNDEIKKISKNILKSFKNNEISIDNQRHIRDISNLMLESKMKPNPYFRNFLSMVIQINEDIIHKSKLSSWLEVCENMLLKSNSSSKLLKYCDFSRSFLTTRYLRNSKSVRWLADDIEFSFKESDGVPYIDFQNKINLVCSNKNGAFTVFDTKGRYWIFNNKWEGNTGFINWEDSGFSADSVYAYLFMYSIDIRKSDFRADSVKFYNKKLFSFPIIGEIFDKAVSASSADNYPVFKSYRKDIVLLDILNDVDYKGGYTLRGSDFIADGRSNASARIIIKRDNNCRFIKFFN